jgi:hypothetical protein
MASAPLRLHFENPAGRVFEQPAGRGRGHIEVEHSPGPRRFSDLQTLLGHAKQLLTQRGWHKLLGDQRFMVPFTAKEEHWVTAHWLKVSSSHSRTLLGAVVLPADVYAQLPADVAATPGQASAMTYRLFNDPELARTWLKELR